MALKRFSMVPLLSSAARMPLPGFTSSTAVLFSVARSMATSWKRRGDADEGGDCDRDRLPGTVRASGIPTPEGGADDTEAGARRTAERQGLGSVGPDRGRRAAAAL